LKNHSIIQNEEMNQLHQTVTDAINKGKVRIKNHQNSRKEKPTSGEKFSDILFHIGSMFIFPPQKALILPMPLQ
jgi:hypothetical protein